MCALIRFSAFVIAVRVSGGHLCEAEALTEPAGETAARCVAICSSAFVIAKPRKRLWQSVSLLKGNTDSFARALRMTRRLVIANTYGVRINFRLPVIAKPRKRLWQSVSLLKGNTDSFARALRMTRRLVIANTYGVRINFRLPVIAKPRKRLWQSVSLLTKIRIFSHIALSITRSRSKRKN